MLPSSEIERLAGRLDFGVDHRHRRVNRRAAAWLVGATELVSSKKSSRLVDFARLVCYDKQ